MKQPNKKSLTCIVAVILGCHTAFSLAVKHLSREGNGYIVMRKEDGVVQLYSQNAEGLPAILEILNKKRKIRSFMKDILRIDGNKNTNRAEVFLADKSLRWSEALQVHKTISTQGYLAALTVAKEGFSYNEIEFLSPEIEQKVSESFVTDYMYGRISPHGFRIKLDEDILHIDNSQVTLNNFEGQLNNGKEKHALIQVSPSSSIAQVNLLRMKLKENETVFRFDHIGLFGCKAEAAEIEADRDPARPK